MNKSIITTVITQKHAQKAVIKHFMEENPVLVGTEFLDWNTFIKSNSITPSHLEYFWRSATLIHAHKKGFPILSKSLNYPSSIDEFIQFMDEMADENIQLEDCPDTSNKDKELKEVLRLLDPKTHPKWISLNQFNKIEDASHIKIIPFYQSFSLKNQINQLINKGATLLPLESVQTKYEAYYAKNPRMEAYGVVQKIAQSSIDYDKTVIVCLDPETIEPLTHYLSQLEIPYTYQKSKTLIESRQFIDCLNFVLNPSMDKLLDVIKSGLIQSEYTLQLLQYIEIASPNINDFNRSFTHLKDTLVENDIWDKRTIKHLLDIETKSEFVRSNYLPLINFNIQSSMDETIKQLFKLFVSYCKNKSALNTLRQCLQASLPYLNSLDMIPYLIHQLDQLSLSETSSTGIQIVGLKDAIIPYMDQMFVLGCSSKNYPQYPVHSGFFDEVYFNQLINGTSSERYLWHMTQLETIFSLSKNTCFTYSVGNYEGKGASLSFEIEDFLKRKNGPSFSPLELIESEVKHEREFKLDPTISKQLFFKDNHLYGSVSSFESFFRCPYQYYLKSGLKLYVQKPFTIDNSLMGTISHAVFEHSVKDAGKDYPNYGLRHLDDTLDPMFDDLKRLYPKQVSRINSIQLRSKVIIQESLLQFSEFEKFTSYVPFSVEYEFNQCFEIDENRKVHLKGFIDRVDVNENYFRVIDYKSSTKELKERSILSGNKLQLPTYAVIGQDIFNHIASGIYYASFGQKNVVSIKPYKYTMTNGTSKLSKADYKLDYDKKRKFEGITFCDAQNNDSSIYFIKGLKDDNGTVISKVEYSFDLLKQAIYELYSLLYSSIDEGIIEKDVVEGSCKYCDYKAICQFRGDEKKERNRTNVPRISLSKEVIEEDETES